jgi:hypothetical protein
MSLDMSECEWYKKPLDPNVNPFGWCRTCGRKLMCWKCNEEHDCIPGKARHICVVTNPAWIMNLVRNQKDE